MSERSRARIQQEISQQKTKVRKEVKSKIEKMIKKTEAVALNLMDDEEMEKLRLENASVSQGQKS